APSWHSIFPGTPPRERRALPFRVVERLLDDDLRHCLTAGVAQGRYTPEGSVEQQLDEPAISRPHGRAGARPSQKGLSSTCSTTTSATGLMAGVAQGRYTPSMLTSFSE